MAANPIFPMQHMGASWRQQNWEMLFFAGVKCHVLIVVSARAFCSSTFPLSSKLPMLSAGAGWCRKIKKYCFCTSKAWSFHCSPRQSIFQFHILCWQPGFPKLSPADVNKNWDMLFFAGAKRQVLIVINVKAFCCSTWLLTPSFPMLTMGPADVNKTEKCCFSQEQNVTFWVLSAPEHFAVPCFLCHPSCPCFL